MMAAEARQRAIPVTEGFESVTKIRHPPRIAVRRIPASSRGMFVRSHPIAHAMAVIATESPANQHDT